MVCSYEEIIDPSCLLHRGKSNHRPKLSTAPWEVQRDLLSKKEAALKAESHGKVLLQIVKMAKDAGLTLAEITAAYDEKKQTGKCA
jgi:hypothetical protein